MIIAENLLRASLSYLKDISCSRCLLFVLEFTLSKEFLRSHALLEPLRQIHRDI